MKTLFLYLLQNSIPFSFTAMRQTEEGTEQSNCVRIAYINSTQGEEILKIASDENLQVEVANGLVISEPVKKAKVKIEAPADNNNSGGEEIPAKKKVKKVGPPAEKKVAPKKAAVKKTAKKK